MHQRSIRYSESGRLSAGGGRCLPGVDDASGRVRMTETRQKPGLYGIACALYDYSKHFQLITRQVHAPDARYRGLHFFDMRMHIVKHAPVA